MNLSDAPWFKSNYSVGGEDCADVAFHGKGAVGLRDSKNWTPSPPD
ncbi:DUF397 domain-containing protein [Nocardia sp. CA2R105]|nr:DUF397 domain-containing protein [Nocardia coffeae]MBY8860651.1 DUF397 domain-containing protein [Nocardia coffeae]